MDPTLKKPSTISKTKTKTSQPTETNPDGSRASKSFYYMSNNLSRFNLYHSKTPSSQRQIINPPSKDIHLQAKAMTVSADSDASKFLLNKPSKQQPQRKAKEGRTPKEASKEELKKSVRGLVNSLKKGACEEELDSKKLVIVKDKDVKDDLEREVKDLKRVSVSLGRRSSFCGSQVELADVLASCGVKIVSVDMPPFMQIHAVDFARKTCDSLEKFTAKTLALTLKKEFDGVYGPAWHCIVGTSFGSFVTHSVVSCIKGSEIALKNVIERVKFHCTEQDCFDFTAHCNGMWLSVIDHIAGPLLTTERGHALITKSIISRFTSEF